MRNEVKLTLRRKYDAYVLSLGYVCNSKFWSFFKKKTKSPSTPVIIHNDSDDTECTDAYNRAQLFNIHFISVFNSNASVPVTFTLHRNPAPAIPVPTFSADDITIVVSHLDIHKVCAPNDIAQFLY